MKPVILHPEAEAEMVEAAEWYSARGPSLGRRFRMEIEAAFQRIAANPEMSGRLRGEVRCHLVNRFPYAILYEIRADCIFVVAVMHTKRKPGYWRDRI